MANNNLFPNGAGISVVNMHSGEVEHGRVVNQQADSWDRQSGVIVKFDSGSYQEVGSEFFDKMTPDFDPRNLKYGPK